MSNVEKLRRWADVMPLSDVADDLRAIADSYEELEKSLAAYKEDADECNVSHCWHCGIPDTGPPERCPGCEYHEGPKWQHFIDPGDGLPSKCNNSDMLEEIYQRELAAIAKATP